MLRQSIQIQPSFVTSRVVERSLRTADFPTTVTNVIGWGLFTATYAIIANWIYQGYVDYWDGTYGVGDDDDD